MQLPYSLRSYGQNADAPLGLSLLDDPADTVYLDDEYSYISIFLDLPEANHVYCAGIVNDGHMMNYFQRSYSDAVIALAWRHGLPLRIHHSISDDELVLFEAHLKHRHGLEASGSV